MDPAEKNAKIHELLAKIHDLESEVNFLRNVGETYVRDFDDYCCWDERGE